MFNAAERNSQSVVIIMLRTCPSERAPRAPCPGLSPATQVGWGRGVRALRGSRAPSAAGVLHRGPRLGPSSWLCFPKPPRVTSPRSQARASPLGSSFGSPRGSASPAGGTAAPRGPCRPWELPRGQTTKGFCPWGETGPGLALPPSQPHLGGKLTRPRKAPTDRRRAPRLPRRPLQPLGSMAGPWGLARGTWRQCPLARPPHTTAAGLSGVRPDSWCVPR